MWRVEVWIRNEWGKIRGGYGELEYIRNFSICKGLWI